MNKAVFHLYFVIICICLNDVSSQQKYEIPEATVELLNPKGFSVSIPDQTGIKLFAFHGKLNEVFTSHSDGGYYSRDIIQAKNGRWTYTDRNTKFKIGDVLHYWLFVDYFDGRNQLGSISEFRKFVVTECPGNIVGEQGVCNAPEPSEFQIPPATIEVLRPQGFSVSIPDQAGIELFAFHGKVNQEFEGREGGTFSRDIITAKNGRWTFVTEDIKLNSGDTLYYWLYVVRKHGQEPARGYTSGIMKYVVNELGTTESECRSTDTSTTGAESPLCSGNLIFQDNFDEPNIDQNKWTIEQYIPYISEDDHNEFVSYQNRNDNRFIRSSILYLKPVPLQNRLDTLGNLDLSQGCTRETLCTYTQVGGYILPPITSAKIRSKMSFKYGKVEIRAKVPVGDWIYPQIELIPKNSVSYPKILMAYARGNEKLIFSNNEDIGNSLLLGGPVQSKSEPERSRNLRSRKLPTPLGRNMRTYTVVWTPAQIDVLVDNDLYGTVYSNDYSGFNTEFQIVLGVGVGGNFDFPDGFNSGLYQKPWTNFAARPMKDFFSKRNIWSKTWQGDDVALQVDSVKVWAL